jgi:spermidine/putrescine transport system ATP-binding protein
MRNVELKNVSKSYDGELILDKLNLTIPSGKFFALLGPSGCGKTTILRLIGGFEQVDSGSLYLGEKNITDLPSNKRSVNTVFQNYALFPHLNVFDNIAYGLTVRGVSQEEIKRRVTRLVDAFDLAKHVNKSVDQLSGGQQQRVALARAIINEPDVLLLDEPLAALDYRLRERMLVELIELQEELKTTFLYVTHDPFEALTVADQLAIMNLDGQVEQIGTPEEIYEFPVSAFVAEFVGITNIFAGVLALVEDSAHVVVSGFGTFPVEVSRRGRPKPDWMENGRKVLLSIRPEKILITKKSLEGFGAKLSGVVESIVYHGRSTQYNVRINDDYLVRAFEQNEEHRERLEIDYRDSVYLYWQQENVVVLER